MTVFGKSIELLDSSVGLHEDGWLGPDATLDLSVKGKASKVALAIWNPYYAGCYLDNRVKIKSGRVEIISNPLGLGDVWTVEIPVNSKRQVTVTISSDGEMVPDHIDQRARTLVLKSIDTIASIKTKKSA